MSAFQALAALIQHAEQMAHPQGLGQQNPALAAHLAQAAQAQRPDITYNPNPNTNIPYSTHNAAQARAMAQPLQVAMNAPGARGTGLQGVQRSAYPQALGAGFNDLPQGNNFNPGYTPLQNNQLGLSRNMQMTAPQARTFTPPQGNPLY